MVIACGMGKTLDQVYEICKKRRVETQQGDPAKEFCTDGDYIQIQEVVEQGYENC